MSTYYYARIIPTKERKEELKKLIDEDKYNEVIKLTNELYGEAMPDINVDGAEICIGKRSGGWKFLWNANREKYYIASKESIIEFLNRDDVIIYDEYYDNSNSYSNDPDKTHTLWTTEQFLNMALNWEVNGMDGKKYSEREKEQNGYSMYERYGDHEGDKFWVIKGYTPAYYEFYSKDGLRWSTTSEF